MMPVLFFQLQMGLLLSRLRTHPRCLLPAQGSERGYWGPGRLGLRKYSHQHCVSDQTQGHGIALAMETEENRHCSCRLHRCGRYHLHCRTLVFAMTEAM